MTTTILTNKIRVYQERMWRHDDPHMANWYRQQITQMQAELNQLEAKEAVDNLVDELWPKDWTTTTDCLQTKRDLYRDESIEVISDELRWSWKHWKWVWVMKFKRR